MSAIEILPFILFIVVMVTAIAERISIPYPLLLVITGLIVGLLPNIPAWHPPEDMVLSLFLPPILFSAARLTSWSEIRLNISTIINLSFILVLLSAIIIAFVLNHYLSVINLASAFVLGAIIAPTDTVAACSILQRMNAPQKIIKTIEIESLFNDAAGIIFFKIALFYLISGSLSSAVLSAHSLWVGCGGILIGFVFAYLTRVIIEQFLVHSNNQLPIIMSLVLAYVSYLFADRLGVSGVLAVVTAGIYQQKTETKISAQTRLTETSVWDTLIFFLNGIIFITIGIQFPSYLQKVSNFATSTLIYASSITILTMLCLRLIWVLLTQTIQYYCRNKKEPLSLNQLFIESFLVSWSGMRGLVSMSLAISLPFFISINQPFPDRDLIIFLTFITILFTLLVQGLTLPFILRQFNIHTDHSQEQHMIESIHRRLTTKAIKKMQSNWDKTHNTSPVAKTLVENYYAHRVENIRLKDSANIDTDTMTYESEELLSHILQYERTFLAKLRNRGEISDEIYIKLLRKIDLDEVGFESFH